MTQEQRNDLMKTEQVFSRQGHADWMASLKRVARAQAILWHETPISERQKLLIRVDQEREGLTK